MSKTQDLSYDEPWDMFAEEEHPWKDLDRLLEWEGKLDTQMELGDAFGCSPSTISYWLDKAKDEVEPEYDDEELHCRYHDVCGNLAPGPKNHICRVCLDLARHNSGAKEIDPDDSSDYDSHIEKLYEEYPELAEQSQAVYDDWHSDDESKDSENED
jgi:hypothetical protein